MKGYQLLTLGWSDGVTFVPLNFSLMASAKHLIQGLNESLDKRTVGYKRRQEALQSKPKVVAQLIDQALTAGVRADYVLMDTWFTEEPLIQAIQAQGLDVIGMIKRGPKRLYSYKGKRLTLDRLLSHCHPIRNPRKFWDH